MKKKLSLFIITLGGLFIFCHSVDAKLLSKELVDLHKSHWAYNATTKLIDKYELIQGFPDHTFRGEKGVNRYELSVIILNMIKYLEDKQKISLKPTESISSEFKNKSLTDIPKSSWAEEAILNLRDNYSLILSPPYEKKFGGKKNINRFELAYTIDKVISLVSKQYSMDNNPYEVHTPEVISNIEKKITPDNWAEQSVKNIIAHKIMIGFGKKNSFNGLEEVNRYQLAIVLNKALEYMENIKVN